MIRKKKSKNGGERQSERWPKDLWIENRYEVRILFCCPAEKELLKTKVKERKTKRKEERKTDFQFVVYYTCFGSLLKMRNNSEFFFHSSSNHST